MNRSVNAPRREPGDLHFDSFARVFIPRRPMACDEQGDLLGLRCPGERSFLDHGARLGQEHASHAFMGANGLAIKECLVAAPLHAVVSGLAWLPEAQRLGDDRFTEKTFADEQGQQEDARSRQPCDDLDETRFLFPKGLAHLREAASAPQLGCLAIHGGSRLGVGRRAMSKQHQRRVGKLFLIHVSCIVQEPRPGKDFAPPDQPSRCSEPDKRREMTVVISLLPVTQIE